MSSTAQKVLKEALALPEDDRRRVAEMILDSMPAEAALEIEQAWAEEASRRAGALERGETEAIDGDEAVSRLEAQLHRIHHG